MRVLTSALIASLLLWAGCDDAPTGLTQVDVAGTYRATTLDVTENGATTDALADGASLTVTLESDGTTTGTFVVPASLSESGQEETYDLAGSWSLSERSVTFEHSADTFLRNTTLRFADGRLEGEEMFDGVTVAVVLERQ